MTTRSWVPTSGLAVLALALAGVALPGCAALSQPYPAQQFHVLQATMPAASPAKADRPAEAVPDAVLRVRTARVAPPFDDQGLIYRMGETRYERDFYQQFLTRPHEMITEVVTRTLRDYQVCRVVLDGLSGADAHYVLETVVTELYADCRAEQRTTAVLAIEFFLLVEEPGHTSVLLQRTYHEAEPVGEDSLLGTVPPPEDLVRAWNRALGRILADLAVDLQELDLQEPGK